MKSPGILYVVSLLSRAYPECRDSPRAQISTVFLIVSVHFSPFTSPAHCTFSIFCRIKSHSKNLFSLSFSISLTFLPSISLPFYAFSGRGSPLLVPLLLFLVIITLLWPIFVLMVLVRLTIYSILPIRLLEVFPLILYCECWIRNTVPLYVSQIFQICLSGC